MSATSSLRPEDAPRRIGIAELEQRLGRNRATIWRWYKAGNFPVPHYLGERRCWFEREIAAWEAAQMARPAEARRGSRNLTAPTAAQP
jgi:predicted DNA-binding transcriptional regulator AlpA